ncbi:MAG: hypothetical protein M3Z75_21880 [Actinomycetota bacterium]|nr:hypothetical protein [Actinomycetota bacterium]
MAVIHVLWGWSALTLLVDIALGSWLWRTWNADLSVPGQPGAIQVGHTTITGPTQALIVVGLYISNVCLIICTIGLVLDALVTLV